MAAEYFLYTTEYTNTLIDRSESSFAPLPPNTGEIFINYFIPNIQPLYYYRESGGTIVLNSEANINAYLQSTAPPPQPQDNVLQFEFTGYTASTDTKINNLIQSLSGVSTGTTVDAISFHANAAGNVTINNQSSALQFLANNNRNIRQIDLTNALQIRLTIRVTTASASANNPRLLLRYSTGFTTTVGNYLDVGVSEISASLSSAGISTSNWIDIVPAAKGDVFLAMMQIGGDGAADPQTGNVVVEIRKMIKTAETLISGVTKQEFDSYTGVTDTRLDTIDSNITYISGITDTKLNTTTFNTFTGTTLPVNYYNKTEINAYTGLTAGQIDLKLNISDYNLYTGNTDTILNGIDDNIDYLSGITDTKLNTDDFTGYTATTESKLWSIFQPLDGTTPDDQRFEEYATQQLANGQPIFLHDPNDLGFKFTGLTTGKDYNKLPWIGVNGGNSAPRLKLGGGSVFSTAGIRGVEFFIEADANVELLGLSEHSRVDLTEIRFEISATLNKLTLSAVNMTVGRIEGQTGSSDLIIKDRSNIQVQNLNEIENVYVEGGSILTANWVRINTLIELGFDGTSVDNDGAIVTLAKPQNLTSGEVIIYGQNNILTASNFPITIDSGATNNVILGMNNTITDNGTNNIILQNLTGGTGAADGVVSGATLTGALLALQRTIGLPDVTVDLSPLTGGTGTINWGDISGTLTNQTDLQNALDNKLDVSDFNSYTGTTATILIGIEDNKVNRSGDTITGDLKITESLYITGTSATTEQLQDAVLLGAITSDGRIVTTNTPALNVSEAVTDITSSTGVTEISGIYYVDTTIGDITLTIPNADSNNDAKKMSIIKKDGVNNVIITTVGGIQNIGNQTTQTISQIDKGLTIVADNDNSKWIVVQDSRYVEGSNEGEFQFWDNTLKIWRPTTNDITWDNTGLTFNVGGNSTPQTFQVNASDDIVYINTSGLTGLVSADDLGFYAGGRGAFGNAVTLDRLRANAPGNVPRSLSLIDTNSVMRIWRYVNDSNDPAVELVWGTGATPSTVGNAWWDMFLDGAASPNDAFSLRRRTEGSDIKIFDAYVDRFSIPLTTTSTTPTTGALQISGGVGINENLNINGITKLGNVTPDVNQQNFTVIDNTTKKLANSGTKFHVYGSEFQYAESLEISTTTSTSPQTKVTLVTTDLPSGTYKIEAVAKGRHNNNGNDMIFDVTLNGGSLDTTTINIEPQDVNSYYPIVIKHFQILSGVNTIAFRYWNESGGNTTYIADATLELIRVQ